MILRSINPKIISFSFLILPIIFSSISVWQIENIQYSYYILSLYSCLTIVLSFCVIYVLGHKATSLFSLFLITYAVFLLGRFFYFLIGGDQEIFYISYFVYYTLNSEEALKVTLYVASVVPFMTAGWLLTTEKNKINYEFSDYEITNSAKFILWLFIFSSVSIILLKSASGLINVLSGGYHVLYQNQGESYQASGFSRTFFYCIIGLTFSFGNRLQIKFIIFSLLILGVMLIVSGQRGGFVTILLFLLWVYGINNRVSWLSLLKYMAIFIVLLMTMSFISFRALDTEASVFNFLESTLYSQGFSMMVFDASTKVDEYPLLPLLQSFIPGASRIASLFIDMDSSMVSYGGYMASELNRGAYENGQGLGWTIPSSFYVWAQGNIFIYWNLAFLFGCVFGLLEKKSFKNKFYFGLVASLAINLFFLSRDQFSSIFPQIIYFSIFYVFFVSVNKLFFKSR